VRITASRSTRVSCLAASINVRPMLTPCPGPSNVPTYCHGRGTARGRCDSRHLVVGLCGPGRERPRDTNSASRSNRAASTMKQSSSAWNWRLLRPGGVMSPKSPLALDQEMSLSHITELHARLAMVRATQPQQFANAEIE
jgi:hypothetical protein